MNVGDKITGFVGLSGWKQDPFFRGTVEEVDAVSMTAVENGISAWFENNEEHIRWIHGWHNRNSAEVRALETAYSLRSARGA